MVPMVLRQLSGKEAVVDMRTVLVHLNVTVPESGASADEIADVILAAIEVGNDSDEYRNVVGTCYVECVLAEDIS